MSLHCCDIGGKCSFEGFLDLGPVLVSISNMFIFELGEPSLSKGFSSSFGHPIEENHSSHFIGELVHMKDEVDHHGHEPSFGISGFSAEFFKEGSFNVHHLFIVIFFI